MHVVVVESPAKAKTIEGYLGSSYKVIASFGHIRDLPSSEGSVKPENDFEMSWEMDSKGKKQTKIIQDALKSANSLILATDPDREGEAIAWHVLQALNEKGGLKDKDVSRVTFNAITKKTVIEAIENPRELDKELINAYLARRALDYLVGFTLSPVLWRKLPGARSAGRVQSVALRLLCEREIEIESFIPKEYWSINSFLTYEDNPTFKASLTHYNKKKIEQFDIKNSDEAEKIKEALNTSNFVVEEIDEKEVSRKPSPPFITSSMQMEASRKLGMSAKNTMQVAQRLYQNGLITYMRTDGVQIGQEGITEIRSSINTIYGDKYLPSKSNEYKSKITNAQEAHEAIRPTDASISPERIGSEFSKEEILHEDTNELLVDMWETLDFAGGIGLAAPQIGVSKQLAVIKLSEDSDRYPDMETTEPYVIFNPQITVLDKELQGFWEGCLSVPGLRGYVERPRKVKIDYLDEKAVERTIEVEDFLATVFQHELDHLIGMLYVDRMEDVSTLMFEDEMVLQEVSEEEILD